MLENLKHKRGLLIAGAAFVVAAAATTGVTIYTDVAPALDDQAEKRKSDILAAFKANLPNQTLGRADECIAHYIARQQNDQSLRNDRLRQEMNAGKKSAAEIEKAVSLSHKWDGTYAMHVWVSCHTGQRPAEHTAWYNKQSLKNE